MTYTAVDGVWSNTNLFKHAINDFIAFYVPMNAFAEIEIDTITLHGVIINSHFVAHFAILEVYATGFDFSAQNWFHPIL